jgi:protein O-mannosyl-transferase
MSRQTDLSKAPSASQRNAERWQVVVFSLVLVAMTFAVFGQTAHFHFVNLDDDLYVYGNFRVESGLTWKGFVWVWTHPECYFYHPLTMLSLMADAQWHGANAGGYHLTNVFIHAASTVLLFLSLRRMTGAIWRSAFVAAVFAIHPLRVESVAWVAERKDVLSALFFMLTLWAYAHYVQKPSRARYFAVALVFALGLLCKNMLVTLPVVLLLLDWWPLGRMKLDGGVRAEVLWPLVKEKIPLFLLSLAAGVLGSLILQQSPNSDHFPLSVRSGNAVVSYAIYLWQTAFPEKLAIPYLVPAGGWPVWKIGLALALLGAISVLVWAWRKAKPYLVVGWLWYLVMLLPVIGFIQVSYHARADRYTYLPGIGVALAVAWWAGDWSQVKKWRRAAVGPVMAIVIGAMMMCAWVQTGYWKDGETLWRHTVACDPENRIALNNLGNALLLEGKADEAEGWLQKASAANPTSALIYVDLGLCYMQMGRVESALSQYQAALKLEPRNSSIQNDLAWILATGPQASLRDGGKAVELASSANAQMDGKSPEFLDTLAAAFAEAGRFPEAMEAAHRALPLAEAQLNAALVEELRTEMKFYQAGKPLPLSVQSGQEGNH